MRTKTMIRFPAVLLAGNAADTELTADPCAALDCTSAMLAPPPPPLALIIKLNALSAVNELASLTCTVKLLAPVPVGVPEIIPVLGASVSPAGKVPESIDHVYGVVPPVAASVALYAEFC